MEVSSGTPLTPTQGDAGFRRHRGLVDVGRKEERRMSERSERQMDTAVPTVMPEPSANEVQA